MHGKFRFQLQKYQFYGQRKSYFELSGQLDEGYISPRLQELCGYFSNRMSYEEVAKLVETVSSECLLSNQKIGQIVSAKALKLSQILGMDVGETLAKTACHKVKVNSQIDIYKREEKEIMLFDDGIQVKRQKEQMQTKAMPEEGLKNRNARKNRTSAIATDVVMLQKGTGEFEYIAAPINTLGEESVSLADVVKANVFQEYGSQTNSLNLVAITDGLKAIRNRLLAIFGVAVP